MKIEVNHFAGAHIVIGNYPYQDYAVGLKDPWGNTWISTTGDKAKHGAGGFEFLVPNSGTPYTLTIAGEAWEFAHRAGLTEIVFVDGKPSPPVEPDPEPKPEPVPWVDDLVEPEPPEYPEVPENVLAEVAERLIAIVDLLKPYYET